MGYGIHRHFTKVTGVHEILQADRGLLFISCVLVDYAPHFPQIVLQNGFSGIEHHGPVHGYGNRRQYPEDRDDDHQLEKSKTVSLWERGARQKRAG